MRLPAQAVKTPRPYDASARRAAAARRRAGVVDAAAARFAADGYAAATVVGIASDAGVSAETVYKTFGGKPGLVRAIWDRALAGQGPVHAEERSDAVSGMADDPLVIIDTWARLSTEVAPLGTPVLLLVRDAAASDPGAAALLEELDAARLRRMTHNAKAIQRHLRPGLTVSKARDILFAVSAPGLYETLVMHRGWSLDDFAEFLRRTMAAQLLG